MAENESNALVSAAVPFVLGGVVGAAIALLFAPASGEETRERVASWINEGRMKTKEYLAEKRGTLSEKKERIGAAFEAGKKAYREAEGADQHEHHKATSSVA